MLSITGLKNTSEVSGVVYVHLELEPCTGIVNDWNLEIDNRKPTACLNSIDFVNSSFTSTEVDHPGCLCFLDDCPHVQKNRCVATFRWDTTQYCSDTVCTLTASANGETISIQIRVNNDLPSYRILNKQMTNAQVIDLQPAIVELEVTPDLFTFIETLPNKTGYIDLEINSNELFTQPYNGETVISGDKLIERILKLQESEFSLIGDSIQVDLPETTASYFMEEFSNNARIQVALPDSTILDKEIVVLHSTVFPATHARVAEGE